MKTDFTVERIDGVTWMLPPINDAQADELTLKKCNRNTIQNALRHVPGAEVNLIELHRDGTYFVPPPPAMKGVTGAEGYTETELPDFCRVLVAVPTPVDHTLTVEVWVPLIWNGRFVGCGAGGNRLYTPYLVDSTLRHITPPVAVRNGFAAATCDGGYEHDERFADWELDRTTGTLDWGLIENWVHRGTAIMTKVGKAVTSAIHGMAPDFSYFIGTSGGGRQAIVNAQMYPESYDGTWSSDPAINWTRTIPAMLWPALVMKEHHCLSPAKLDAFQHHVLEARGVVTDLDATFDATAAIGTPTADGPITDTDAKVMQLIWDGPHTPDGERLWFGIPPGVESWGKKLPGIGLCVTTEHDGDLEPEPFAFGPSWFGSWVQQNEEFDWRELSFESYAELFQKGIEDLAPVASDNPDLTGLHQAGGKLLLSHGTHDQVIVPQGTLKYYREMVAAVGGQDASDDFVRFFLCSGDGHSSPAVLSSGVGAGVDLSTGMVALMNWVEHGHVPETLTMLTSEINGTAAEEVEVPHCTAN